MRAGCQYAYQLVTHTIDWWQVTTFGGHDDPEETIWTYLSTNEITDVEQILTGCFTFETDELDIDDYLSILLNVAHSHDAAVRIAFLEHLLENGITLLDFCNPENDTNGEVFDAIVGANPDLSNFTLDEFMAEYADFVEECTGVEIDCDEAEDIEECILFALFDATFDLSADLGHTIDLAQIFRNCFGEQNADGNYIDCSLFSGSLSATLYVDQPIAGSSAAYSNIRNPEIGHTFIGLNVINNSGSIQDLIFGFYPLNGVKPISSPSALSAIVNDGNHSYDISVTYGINCDQFNQLLNEAVNQSNNSYNLNDYNCTDFGVQTFNNALGINIFYLPSVWPGGLGSSPGGLGQALSYEIGLENGVINHNGGIAPIPSCY